MDILPRKRNKSNDDHLGDGEEPVTSWKRDWLGGDVAFEKEMRKARYSEKRRPPREFSIPKNRKFKPIKKRKDPNTRNFQAADDF